jgi:holo-[acyl-carrier protein] synthase
MFRISEGKAEGRLFWIDGEQRKENPVIYGIGVDLVHIPRMRGVLEKWGDRFVNRVFTPGETAVCLSRAFPASSFALRFAAKEAFTKAMGLGLTGGMMWRDIEVIHDAKGKPGLKIHGKSFRACEERDIGNMHLSLSDEKEYAIAMVVLEKHPERQ